MKPIILIALAPLAACGWQDREADQPSSSESSEPALVSEKDIKGWEPHDSSAGARLLEFDFPDGARGGRGAIRGLASHHPSQPPEAPEAIVRNCGGSIIPRGPDMTHHVFVTIRSGPDDLRIVRCVQQAIATHFSVEQKPATLAQGRVAN